MKWGATRRFAAREGYGLTYDPPGASLFLQQLAQTMACGQHLTNIYSFLPVIAMGSAFSGYKMYVLWVG